MKIRSFGLALLMLLQATAGPYGNTLQCHARNSKEGKKKPPKASVLVWNLLYANIDLQNEQIIRYYIVI